VKRLYVSHAKNHPSITLCATSCVSQVINGLVVSKVKNGGLIRVEEWEKFGRGLG
jgi:hypothetical protein